MRGKPKDMPSDNFQGQFQSLRNYSLMLFNDDVNSFDFIVESLIDICNHDPIQAEQCTFIAHHKGKCDIKLGSHNQLEELKLEFDVKGITTVICAN